MTIFLCNTPSAAMHPEVPMMAQKLLWDGMPTLLYSLFNNLTMHHYFFRKNCFLSQYSSTAGKILPGGQRPLKTIRSKSICHPVLRVYRTVRSSVSQVKVIIQHCMLLPQFILQFFRVETFIQNLKAREPNTAIQITYRNGSVFKVFTSQVPIKPINRIDIGIV